MLRLAVTAEGRAQARDFAEHPLIVRSRAAPAFEVALIVSPAEAQAFPTVLLVPPGALRLYLTSLNETATLTLQRSGEREPLATTQVAPGELTALEIELGQGSYEISLAGANAVLGRLEVGSP